MVAPITIQSVLHSLQMLTGVAFDIKEFAVHNGPDLPWYDGLICKMISASADFLAVQLDPKLETRLDRSWLKNNMFDKHSNYHWKF